MPRVLDSPPLRCRTSFSLTSILDTKWRHCVYLAACHKFTRCGAGVRRAEILHGSTRAGI